MLRTILGRPTSLGRRPSHLPVPIEPHVDPSVRHLLHRESHGRLTGLQGVDAPLHVLDTDRGVEPLLDGGDDLLAASLLRISGD